jgi:FlaA1/EpsC-like NDP-sugar epimerase
MQSFFANKHIVVTGACGTIGQELLRQLTCDYNAESVIGLDNNESELFFMDQRYAEHPNVDFFLADIRDPRQMALKMQNADVVFHAAALKHVIVCERSPFEAVQTNILGIQNVIAAAGENRVGRVIFTSSDKAVNPTNVMGTSKLMGERLITAANNDLAAKGIQLASTRFGNVLGSRGSVISVFKQQIKQGGPVTLTDPRMTRFIMSLHQAVQLVIDTAYLARGGEIFVTKMQAIRIKDLAEVMIEELAEKYGYRPGDIEIKVVGSKPGEKMYEELLTGEETRRTLEHKRYFIILPAFPIAGRSGPAEYPDLVSDRVTAEYNSESVPVLSNAELSEFIHGNHILAEPGQYDL